MSTAKALIESTAKSVLTTRGVAYTKSDKVPGLVNRAQRSLALSAKGVSDEVPALRQILQSLVTMAQGVTEIRNQVGVHHGAESVPTWVRPRHARLVVGAAQVWCQLMLETLADQDAPWRTTTLEPDSRGVRKGSAYGQDETRPGASYVVPPEESTRRPMGHL